MKVKRIGWAVVCAVGMVGLLAVAHARRQVPEKPLYRVERDEMVIWSQYQGRIHSVHEQPVFSRLSQRASITYLVDEGATVQTGDVLVRFDEVELERQISELEKEFVLAESTLESLEKAEIPLAVAELEAELQEARITHRRDRCPCCRYVGHGRYLGHVRRNRSGPWSGFSPVEQRRDRQPGGFPDIFAR